MSDTDPTTWAPSAWRWFLYGHTRGVRSGYWTGYGDALDDMRHMAVDLAETNPSRAIPHAVLERQRGTYATEPRTAEEIQRQAAASWAQVETGIRGAA